jgi:hypothetical protein
MWKCLGHLTKLGFRILLLHEMKSIATHLKVWDPLISASQNVGIIIWLLPVGASPI